MAYQKKVWVNRQSEYPNRRGLHAVSGKENVYEIVREEGLVVEEGDPFDQANMNSLEGRVAGAFTELTNGTVKAGRATTADNATKAYGKTEAALRVSYATSSGSCTGNAATATRATTAATADNATRATTAATADNAIKAYGKAENELAVSWANSAGNASAANNADMVDGLHADSFAPSGYGLGGNCATITDWNTAVKNGWYMGHDAENAPSTVWYAGLVIAHTNFWVTQLITDFVDSNTFYLRDSKENVWSPWRKLIDGGNADAVDGFHIAGKGTSAPGGLSENALYFVYE